MAFVPAHPYRPAKFADLALGAVFRFDGLPAHQICIKAQGPGPGVVWMLVMGGGTGGRFPSPWYGAMLDIHGAAVQVFDKPLAISPTSPPVSLDTPLSVQPGDLIARDGGGWGVFVGDGACIDLTTGKRFKCQALADRAYASWALRYAQGERDVRLFQYPVAEGVAP